MALIEKKQGLPAALGTGMILFLVLAIYSFNISLQNAELDRDRQGTLSGLQSDVYDLMLLADRAAQGDREALAALPAIDFSIQSGRGRFAALANELPAVQVRRFDDQLELLTSNLGAITANSEDIMFFGQQLALLEEQVPAMQQGYTQVVDTMLQAGSPAELATEAQAQVWRSERALASLRQILVGDADPAVAAGVFRNDMLLFNQVLNGMLEGDQLLGVPRVESNQARLLLEQVEMRWNEVSDSIDGLVDASSAVSESYEAADRILRSGVDILNGAQTLSEGVAALPQDLRNRPFGTIMVIYSATAFAIFGFALGLALYRRTRGNLVVQESENEQNQEAILRLLDEIADLAEGDLTVSATVSEDFTGAIADSINYAIEQLRELVASVAITAENVASASSETRATSVRLSEASEHQAEQITQTTSAIGEVADNLTSVSRDAQELATVAESSVDVARNGNQVVQNTIAGMNNIREQIQDTAKRIKRLGESSQEIGDIVSLINEIADQTNILALNASIQAAMAGEAGRGFAVVADEVQSLAERAADATKQIETLVRAIQSDTNEAVSSMEQTTSEVVTGAQLANSAGEALTEIQSTSENLARLILAISEAASHQSQAANRASRSMRVISDITEQTLAGSTESSRAIGELTEQALQLRASVAGFKLPDSYLSFVYTDPLADKTKVLDPDEVSRLLETSQMEAGSSQLSGDDPDESKQQPASESAAEPPEDEHAQQEEEVEFEDDPLAGSELFEAMEADEDASEDRLSFDIDMDMDFEDDSPDLKENNQDEPTTENQPGKRS